MAIEVRKVGFALGAEVRGIDPSRPLDADTIKAVRAAWLEHQLLIFPGMKMSVGEHVSFSRQFGELEIHPIPSQRGAFLEHPEIMELFNQPRPGRYFNRNPADQWHSDGAYTTRPPLGSMLHCKAIPDVGGDTLFTNMYMAYDMLSPTLKGVIDNLFVVNTVTHSRNRQRRIRESREGAELAASDLKVLPAVVQPMVRVHSETGRKALYMNDMVTERIYGMTREESAGLLDFLVQHSSRPEFIYRHRWHVDDLIWWDNRCSMHIAPDDYDRTQLRHMLRTTLVGEPCGRLHETESPVQESRSA